MDDGFIQFIANYEEWKCIKKYRTVPTTNSLTFAEFLASYSITLDQRFVMYLRTFLDMKSLDTILSKSPGKSASVGELLAFLSSPPVVSTIQSIAKKESNHAGELESMLKAYAARNVLREKGLIVEYAQVGIPGLKRLINKKL
ncbi:MAG: hypothetical protein AABX02_04475 [archaeon]